MPAAFLDIVYQLFVRSKKEGVRFDRKNDVDLPICSQAICKQARSGVGTFRVTQPDVAGEKSDRWRSQETHLRSKLSGLLQPIVKLARQFLLEDHDQFAR